MKLEIDRIGVVEVKGSLESDDASESIIKVIGFLVCGEKQSQVEPDKA